MDNSKNLTSTNRLAASIILILSILIGGCVSSQTQTQAQPESEYSYSIILQGTSTHNAQVFFENLKIDGGARHLEIIELTDNYAECRAVSRHSSDSMFGVVTSVLENQGQHSSVSYSAEKFVIRSL